MDFLNDAVSKAKEALEIACKKTGEVVNTQKQKLDVASLENKCNKLYASLGKIYFEEVKDSENLSDEAMSLVNQIKDFNSKIDELKNDINAAKKLKVCPNCNANIDETDVFCPHCGTKTVFEDEE